MARKPRLHFPGAVYHVILRGNAGQAVFFEDADRYRFYLLLQESSERFGYRLHAFCCMTNHIHLALQAGEIPLSRIMQSLALRYTTWINRKNRRSGHLFQGRYKAILLDADSYLLELVRYIHLNPVRAGLATHPDDYPWSGHRAYLGAEVLPWLTTEWVLAHFSAKRTAAQKKYCMFVAEGIEEPRRQEFHSGTLEGRILGDDRFADEALLKANQGCQRPLPLEEMLDIVCQHYGMTLSELSAPGKTRLQAEARAVAALSQAVRRLSEKLDDNQALRVRIREIGEQLKIFKC